MSKSSTQNAASLLSKLRGNVTKATADQEQAQSIVEPPQQVEGIAPSKKQSPGTRRITTTYAFQPSDVKLIESLKMWCLSQGYDCNSSQIVRAGLQLIPRDHQLIDALKTVKATDGRRKK